MENFRRNGGQGGGQGGYRGGNNYGAKKSWGGGSDDRGFDKPTLHRATCAKCNNSCEVPFKPNGSKPIYCRDCFKKEDGGAPRSFDRNRGSDRNAGASSFPEKRMYPAVCEDCGSECEVPFRPTGEKPVYCRACFGGNKNAGPTDYKSFKASAPAGDQNKEQFAMINSKLDLIMKSLNIVKAAPAAVPVVKTEKAPEKPVVKAAAVEEAPKEKKAAKKKVAAKKKK